MTKILYKNFEKSFLQREKMASRNIFRHFFHAIFNHTGFSFNLKLICTCEFAKKLKLHSSKQLVQFPLFEKLTGAN